MSISEEHRISIAFHEASHAVIAYYFGWWVSGEGVEVNERWYCGLSHYSDTYTAEADICINLAGWPRHCRTRNFRARGMITISNML